MFILILVDMTKFLNSGAMAFIERIPVMLNMTIGLTHQSLNFPEFRKIMDEESFDLVISGWFLNTFSIGLGAHFNCPVILLNVVREFSYVGDLMGNPSSISFVPHLQSSNTGQMNFFARLKNMLLSIFTNLFTLFIDYEMEKYYNINFPQPRYPSYADMKKNISLALINYHFSQGIVRPTVPAMIDIGGVQAKQIPSPLPKDIEEWISSAEHGAVLVSLGSNLKSKDLPIEKKLAIFETLKNLKQHVIWKFEDDTLENIPKNIKLWKWLPQDDILAHPNLKLFITHGGGGSIVESRYHGVPIVGIPVFAEQPVNVANAEREGWGIGVPYEILSYETLSTAVNKILVNSTYTDKVKYLSNIYRDRPMTNLDTAIFWIEYVIRHHGAKHIQSNSIYLNFWQFYSLDVIGFLSLILILVIYINVRILKIIYRKISSKLFLRKDKKE